MLLIGVGSAGRGWGGKSRLSESSCGNCTEEEEEMAAPPEYRHAFSNAMAKALDAATAAKKAPGGDINIQCDVSVLVKLLFF